MFRHGRCAFHPGLPLLFLALGADASDPKAPAVTKGAAGVTFAGQGQTATDPQHLAAGNYKVHYRLGGDCYYSANLKGPDDSLQKSSFVTGSKPFSGDTNVYGIKDGDYFVDMTTGPAPDCPWTLEFSKK